MYQVSSVVLKMGIIFFTVLVFLGIGFSDPGSVFAAEEASSIVCDNGVVNIGDTDADVQDACGEPNSQNHELNAWQPSQSRLMARLMMS